MIQSLSSSADARNRPSGENDSETTEPECLLRNLVVSSFRGVQMTIRPSLNPLNENEMKIKFAKLISSSFSIPAAEEKGNDPFLQSQGILGINRKEKMSQKKLSPAPTFFCFTNPVRWSTHPAKMKLSGDFLAASILSSSVSFPFGRQAKLRHSPSTSTL
jgi:hypothetical protein